MAVDIDKLQIEIEASSNKAAQEIDALAASLERLRTTVRGGAGLQTVTKQLQALNQAAAQINASGLKKLSESFDSLKNSSGAAEALASTARTARSAKADYSSLSDEVQEAAKQFAALPASVQASANALSRAKEAMNGLSGSKASVSLDEARASLESLKNSAKDANSIFGRLKSALTANKSSAEAIGNAYASLPKQIRQAVSANAALESSNKKTAKSFGVLGTGVSSAAVKFGVYAAVFGRIAGMASNWLKESNDYIENLNLFNVAMGRYAKEAQDYANAVNEALSIDPSEWMQNQGIFMQIASGFGVVEEKAYQMSKNLTQIGYDISSFFNIGIEESMEKVQSGISGELEPLRRLGYALDQATLQEIAYRHGIEQSFNTMTQAQKSQLRYIAILEQSGNVMGDMARTVQTPANAMRILDQQMTQLARAAGNLLIPALQGIIPVVQAVVEVLTEAVQALANLFGFELPTIDYSGLSGISGGASEAEDALEGAADAAKDLKNATLGIDELNIISPNQGSSGSGGAAGSDWELELPEYDFLEGATLKGLDELKDRLKTILHDYVLPIAGGFAMWKLAEGLLSGIEALRKNLSGLKLPALGGFGLTLGIGADFFDNIKELIEAVEDIIENGPNFDNVTRLISSFAGALGDAFFLLGQVKIAGALKIVEGVAMLANAIADIAKNGLNIDNVLKVVDGVGAVLVGIGLLSGNTGLTGVGLILQGSVTVIEELKKNWEAIKNGDWSGVDKANLAIGALQVLGGILTAISAIKKAKDAKDAAKNMSEVAKTVKSVGTATESLNTEINTGLSPKMTSLAKNLGLGLVVVTEVAAAAAIITGAIVVLGYELKAVGDAWQPVLDNGETVLTGIGLGTALLASVGLVCYALGTAGTTVALNIGIGAAILLELGVAAGLFIAEIWAVGKGLDEIGKAWQPVLDNGEDIATAIGVGTGFLVAIGVVTAALGAVTVASAGALPVAIGIGTAVLVELAAAFVLFTKSLTSVADELSGNLAPAMGDLNEILPDLKSDMEDFVDYMTDFADEVASYTKSMGSVTWSSLVGGFLKLFAGSPISDFADSVGEVGIDTADLILNLEAVNPELESAVELTESYVTLLKELQDFTEAGSSIELSDMSINMKEIGKQMMTGLAEGIGENKVLAETAFQQTTATMLLYAQELGDSELAILQTVLDSFLSGLTTAQTENQTFAAAMTQMFQTMADSSVTAIGSIITQLNAIPRNITTVHTIVTVHETVTAGSSSGSSGVSARSVKAYASGGFPQHGQLFLANEDGPELIGAIGSRTAVANQGQIEAGIQSGVENANVPVVAALYQAIALLERIAEKDTTVELDGEEIASAASRRVASGYNLGLRA